MKALANLSFFLALGVIGAACSSSSNLTKSQEYDDMYFSSSDRQPAYLVTAEYNEQSSFNDEYVEPLSEEKVESFQDVNYSSKTVNPEYIEKYSSDSFSAEESEEEVEYFDESYSQYDTEDGYKKYVDYTQLQENPNQYSTQGFNSAASFGTSWMFANNPYSFYNPHLPYANPFAFDTFGRPMGYTPYGYGYNRAMRFHMGYTWGFGNPIYSPYGGGFLPMGAYDPFFYNDPFFTGFNVGFGYGFGGGFGSPFGGAFGAPIGFGGTGFATAPVVSSNDTRVVRQNTTYGARSSRSNNAVTSSQRNQYRTGNSTVRDDQTRVELPRSRTKTSEQGNYYRRSRSSNSDAYASSSTTTRSYQRYRRSATNSTTDLSSTRNSRTSSTSSNYRTSPGRSSSGSSNQYRTYERRGSSFGNTTRSSGSGSYRSSGSRSNTSFGSGSRSTPTRSTGSFRGSSGSRGSSGATRSSSSSRRRN